MTTSAIDLLPCPFCGAEAERRFNTTLNDNSMAQCRSCGASAYDRKWNARVSTLPIAGEGKVKAQVGVLVWRKPLLSNSLSRTNSIAGAYRVWTHHEANGQWFWQLEDGEEHIVGSEAEGKAAAQSDYETRILSALISSPGKDGGQEVEAVGSAVHVVIYAEGDHENTPAEAVHHMLSRACEREGNFSWSDDTQPASTALVERLTKALEPFADAADYFSNGVHRPIAEDALPCGPALIVKHLREARAALSASSKEGESRG